MMFPSLICEPCDASINGLTTVIDGTNPQWYTRCVNRQIVWNARNENDGVSS